MPRLDLLKFVLPEHCTSNTERMARNRTMQIRNTMFNLVGFTVWEDIFGEINRYSWDERVLIYRYNKLVHDHLDAFLSDSPEPLLATRPFGVSAGRDPFENASQENPPTYDFPFPPTYNAHFTGLYVNKFPARNKILYSLYHRDHDNVDRFHDNRLTGRLIKVDIPDGWHMVNIWDGLPIEVVVDNAEKWAYTNLELPDQSCFLVALPEKIVVKKNDTVWTVRVPQAEGGELRLVGMDVDRRPIYAPEVPASRELSFSADQVPANVNGYVMVQYLKNKVVQDVTVVCIQD